MKIGTIRHFHAEKAAVFKPAVSHQEIKKGIYW